MSQPLWGRLGLALATATFLVTGTPAQAYDFTFDNPDLTGHLDTTLSVGAMWRVSSRDPKLSANGPYGSLVSQGIASQVDKNDADNNFDPGKLASLVYKITPSLHLNWKDTYGVIVSGTYFYDQRIMDGTRDQGFDPCTGTNVIGCPWYPDNTSGKRFSDATRRYAGHYGRMLDTYVWGNFNLGEMPLTVKAGRQVINWGESLFIIGGVNSANYYDRNALLLPGSEIREALLPLDSLYFNLGLTDSLTAEAFYQFNWKPNFDVPDGSYFATSDSFPGHGSDNVLIDGEAVSPAAAAAFAAYNASQGRLAGINYARQQDQVALHRGDDEDPKDSGQFGLALRYEAESLNSTNFSFYFTNTHSKFPITGARMGEANWLGTAQGMAECSASPACNAVMNSGPSGVGALNTAHMIDTTQYFLVYPEDVQMYGVSFNTSINKLALSGEIAYRPSRYIINEFPDNLIAEVAGAAQGLSNSPSGTAHLTDHCIRTSVGGACIPGGLVNNSGSNYYFYDTVQSYSGSLVGIYTFGPTWGADNLLGVVEVGMEHLQGLNKDLHYASTASVMQLPGAAPGTTGGEGATLDPNHPWDTYLDPTSWGYRVAVQAEFNNLIPQTSFKPSVRVAHDVNGNSAIGGNFMEDRKAATLTLDFVVKSKFDVALSGTSFWGARYSNKLGDRDNVSLAMSYSF